MLFPDLQLLQALIPGQLYRWHAASGTVFINRLYGSGHHGFVLDPAENPYNVIELGKRRRVKLMPPIALKDGNPFLVCGVKGGDTQDQNILQFFLNMVEFGMTVQEACEAANLTSFQMRSSSSEYDVQPGKLTLVEEVPFWVRKDLECRGYWLKFEDKNSGPLTAIYFDREHGTF